MASPMDQNRVARRATTVRSWAFFAFLVLMVLSLLGEVLLDGGEPASGRSDLVRALQTGTVAAISVWAAAVVVLVSLRGGQRIQGHHTRTHSVAGRRALTVFETCALAVLGLLVVSFFWPVLSFTPLTVVFAACLLAAIPAAVVWLLAEGAAGYRGHAGER